MKALFLTVIIAGFFVLLFSYIKSKHFFRCVFSTAIQGIAAVFAVNVVGMLTGLHLAVNWYTLCFSMAYGTPGVVALIMAEFIFSR